MDGHFVHGPDGCSGGIRNYGSCNASAARGDEREVLAWESEVEGVMREMERRVEEEELDL